MLLGTEVLKDLYATSNTLFFFLRSACVECCFEPFTKFVNDVENLDFNTKSLCKFCCCTLHFYIETNDDGILRRAHILDVARCDSANGSADDTDTDAVTLLLYKFMFNRVDGTEHVCFDEERNDREVTAKYFCDIR